ncbi:MAG TPA: hypothetical protein VN721_01950 [Flavipsychrobacter sp.]|nr:hypothetical protein [Flavipsychrobacter sp.]
MTTRNIIIAPCGNKSILFKESWLKHKQEKQFDVCLLFYHDTITNPELYSDVEYFFHLKGFKYQMINELLTRIHPEWLDKYEYFYFLDDDIEIDTRQINLMFLFSRAFGSWISQASLTKNSFCSWPMFKQQRNSFCRYVGQIEVMSPLFDASSLKQCLPTFVGNRSSWGIDAVWSKILDYPKDKLIVFDKVTMRHTLPVGGGELYKKIGVDPQEEWVEITERYNAKKQNYQEYGRLQLVDEHHNSIQFLLIKWRELLAKTKQTWNDYDLNSRIRNQKKRFRFRSQ